jgi:hemerythrin
MTTNSPHAPLSADSQSSAGFAQPARSAGAEPSSANSPLHPSEGAAGGLGRPGAATAALKWDEARHPLQEAEMDAAHREFAELVNTLAACPDAEFPERFKALMNHTRAHFAAEDELMLKSGFGAFGEHSGEHQRVIGELMQFGRGLGRGRVFLARSYIQSGLPEWFELHLATMDAALAAHLAKVRAAGQKVELTRNTLPVL